MFFATQYPTYLVTYTHTRARGFVCIFLAAMSLFNNPNDFEGWSCGKITTCGKFGNVCGGFGVKAKDSDIKKTFMLPAGTYSVSLDFIKIDSWFVCCCAKIMRFVVCDTGVLIADVKV